VNSIRSLGQLRGRAALHLAPILLGGRTPLFRAGTRQRYRQGDVRASSNAVRLIYERLIGAKPKVEFGGIRSMLDTPPQHLSSRWVVLPA
jgi:hypothetical protein